MTDLGFIHRYLPSSGESSRVLLLLHGTGGNENDMLSLGRELDPNASLLSPRGNVLENGAPRFFRRFAEGVFDEEDAARRANELADFISAAANEYKFGRDQLIAVGYSNGANIASVMMLLRPESLPAAFCCAEWSFSRNRPAPTSATSASYSAQAKPIRLFPPKTRSALQPYSKNAAPM